MIRKGLMVFKLDHAIDIDDSTMIHRVSSLMEEELERILAERTIKDYITIDEEVDVTEDQVKSTLYALKLYRI